MLFSRQEPDRMTKLENAIKAAEQLPEDLRERLGDNLLHFIDKYLALRDDLEAAIAEIDAGKGIPAEEAFAELRDSLGA
jgi:predicted transcriptional regulator